MARYCSFLPVWGKNKSHSTCKWSLICFSLSCCHCCCFEVFIFSVSSKVIVIVTEFIFLGINMFWALLRAHFNPCLAAQAKMSLSRAQNIIYAEHELHYWCTWQNRPFHGLWHHLGWGANMAKITMNVWDFGSLGTAITPLQRGRFPTFATLL